MAWTLVTAPDERERCCVVVDDERCAQPAAWKISGSPPAWDDYTHVCGDHAELVREPGDLVEPLER